MKYISGGRPNIVALGGGAFQSDETIELLTNHGVPIWLDCPFEHLERRVAQANSSASGARPSPLPQPLRKPSRHLCAGRISHQGKQ